MFATPTSTTNRLRPNRLRRSRLAPLLVGTALRFAAIAAEHDGAVSCTTSPIGGSRFELRFPSTTGTD